MIIQKHDDIGIQAHTTLFDLLVNKLSKNELELLPKGWQILGGIIVVNIPLHLENRRGEIGVVVKRFIKRITHRVIVCQILI